MHVYNGYPLFLPEAMDRWHSYPPPAPGGFYVVPWLWFDGNQHGGSVPAAWESMIVSRLNQPARVNINLAGYYSPGNMAGTVSARFRNDSASAISGFALFVIAEDSIYFPAPNFDSIHNHVARDFLPDHIGVPVAILPGDSVTVTQSFAIQSGWNTNRCHIIAWLQDTVMLADSTKNIYQSSLIQIADLMVEEEGLRRPNSAGINVMPNPTAGQIRLVFDIPQMNPYNIRFYNSAGCPVCETNGVGTEGIESVRLDLMCHGNELMRPGVYFYQLRSGSITASGKLVLR
jgi:hypothetical protein